MKLKHGLISVDSHAQLDRDAFTSRMSKAKFGDKIPQVIETSDRAMMIKDFGHAVERWVVNGKPTDIRGVTNSPAIMSDPFRQYSPQRWDEMPRAVYQPLERLKVLDTDGVDGEVLFPNPPVQSASFFQDDAEFETACVQAYNDALFEWRRASDRYVPVALLPYLSGVDGTVAEAKRIAKMGYRAALMLAEPNLTLNARGGVIFRMGEEGGFTGTTLKAFNDPEYDKLWATCEDLGLVINWHAGAGLNVPVPMWKNYSPGQLVSAFAPFGFAALAQFLPNLIFSGVLDRYPKLMWVCAESGASWINYLLGACDHEWERHHLWTEGVATRPSESFRRQIFMGIWFETHGMETRYELGVNRLMWQSDFPHNTSTYPNSWKLVKEIMVGVPADEQKRILWKNAAELYGLEVTE